MVGDAPPFWWEKPDWRARLLTPLAGIYGAVSRRRLVKSVPPKVAAPVLCIGNFTVGGAGKTPTAIAISKAALKHGLKPGIVSRGYGGKYKGLHLVDPENDTAHYVGDEPLLLARHAPVVLSANRYRAASHLIEQGCNFIVMDDGFQSARLHMDFALLVVDSMRGIGNGRVIPAGPLRAPLIDQLRKTDALLRIGSGGEADFVLRQASRAGRPTYDAQLIPSSAKLIAGQKWLAFAGIGNPEKFFASVRQAGGKIVDTCIFRDHHLYLLDEIKALVSQAERGNLGLITTAKDYVRIATMPGLPETVLDRITVLDVELEFDRKEAVDLIIKTTIERYRSRIAC
ncbi:tetraacyldisaccharide 4'-kinase [Falsochrobactrum ovis]|uniref:Tetraacyldisaccharide 4'-kinase n=1 Tax=Falsochrobactrum ovis TaxID=1293442 RepID=A0A364JWU1_9HYPH|nr:tetraacyldisaccharide 4'-kinase [Falsochrobactrum ovis]RAK31066.1 lipid-A-disaccharide kinase [Falsochrobactrum ovis]